VLSAHLQNIDVSSRSVSLKHLSDGSLRRWIHEEGLHYRLAFDIHLLKVCGKLLLRRDRWTSQRLHSEYAYLARPREHDTSPATCIVAPLGDLLVPTSGKTTVQRLYLLLLILEPSSLSRERY
jgi:hypothetical protein